MQRKNLQVYLVGGAVRDQLLGIPIKDRDYVVVGASVEQMLEQGFEQVGADFPVFIHPQTQEEYALARREVKTGAGYKGFKFEWENVTLEQDLKRRDLSINAMAQNIETGEIYDFYGGQEDLKNKILRHVSSHFVEDPLRVLRLARFKATFNDFNIAIQTKILCEKIIKAGEIEELTAERVWIETQKALKTEHPENYFEFLQDIDALYPYKQINTLNLEKLKKVKKKSQSLELRFASLFIGVRDPASVRKLCEALKLPNQYKKSALFVVKCDELFKDNFHPCSREIYQILKLSKALNDESFLQEILELHDESDHWKLYFKKLVINLKTIDIEAELKNIANEKKPTHIEQVLIKAIENYNLKYGD